MIGFLLFPVVLVSCIEIELDERIFQVKKNYSFSGTEIGYKNSIESEPFLSNKAIYYIKILSGCVYNDFNSKCKKLFYTKLDKLDEREDNFTSIPVFNDLCRFFTTPSLEEKFMISIKLEHDSDCELWVIDETNWKASQVESISISNSYPLSWNDKFFIHVKSSNESINGSLMILDNEDKPKLISPEFVFKWVDFPIIRPNYVLSSFYLNDDKKFHVDTNTNELLFIGEETTKKCTSLFRITPSFQIEKVIELNSSTIEYITVDQEENHRFRISRDNFFISPGPERFLFYWNPVDEYFGSSTTNLSNIWSDPSPIYYDSKVFLVNSTSFYYLNSDKTYHCSERINGCFDLENPSPDGYHYYLTSNPRDGQEPSFPDPVYGVEFQSSKISCSSEFDCDMKYFGVSGVEVGLEMTGDVKVRFSGMYDYNTLFEKCKEGEGSCAPYIVIPNNENKFLEVSRNSENIGSFRSIIRLSTSEWLALVVDTSQSSHRLVFDWNREANADCLPACHAEGTSKCIDHKCHCKPYFTSPEPDFLTCSECVGERDISENCEKCLKGYVLDEKTDECVETWKCDGIEYTNTEKVCGDGHGKCVGEDECTCDKYYDYDKFCVLFKCGNSFPNDTNVCSSHGICNSPPSCDCLVGFSGVYCEKLDSSSSAFWIFSIVVVTCVVPFYILLALSISYYSYLRRKWHLQRIIDQQEGFSGGGVGGIIPPMDGENERMNELGHFVELETEDETEEDDDDDEDKGRVIRVEKIGGVGVGKQKDEILNLDKMDEEKFTLVEYDDDENYDDNAFK